MLIITNYYGVLETGTKLYVGKGGGGGRGGGGSPTDIVGCSSAHPVAPPPRYNPFGHDAIDHDMGLFGTRLHNETKFVAMAAKSADQTDYRGAPKQSEKAL